MAASGQHSGCQPASRIAPSRPHPEPAGPDNAANLYTFERGVTFKEADGSQAKGRIDLYKSTC